MKSDIADIFGGSDDEEPKQPKEYYSYKVGKRKRPQRQTSTNLRPGFRLDHKKEKRNLKKKA
jgi:hypothetical protein